MKNYSFILLGALLVLAGCTTHRRDIVWSEYPIKPDQISMRARDVKGQEVKVVAGESEATNIPLATTTAGFKTWEFYGSNKAMTDGIVVQFSKELRKLEANIKDSASKSLEVTVNNSTFEQGTWQSAATIDFTVNFGDGRSKKYSVRNSSPKSINACYNGAIALAVVEMINDPLVMDYIKN